MHFEILVEGQSDLNALSILMNQIVGEYNIPHTWRIHKHRGKGRLPDDFHTSPSRNDSALLRNLPSKLRAHAKSMGDQEVVVVLIDLDERDDCFAFKSKLLSTFDSCEQKPNFLVRLASEELETWCLGDQKAIQEAYQNCNQKAFSGYVQDSQCQTWKKLAEAIQPGGLKSLRNYGKRSVRILKEKRKWRPR